MPFPVIGSVHTANGQWMDTPSFLVDLSQDLAKDPLNPRLQAAAAEQYFRQNQLEKSDAIFAKLASSKKPSADPFVRAMASLRQAEILLIKGEVDRSLQALKPLTGDSHAFIAEEAIFLQARCFLDRSDWKAFNETLQMLISRNPGYADDFGVHLIQGIAALEQGHLPQAMELFKPFENEPAALYFEMVCLVRQGDFAVALPIYQRLLQQYSSSPWTDRARLALGEAFYKGGTGPRPNST